MLPLLLLSSFSTITVVRVQSELDIVDDWRQTSMVLNKHSFVLKWYLIPCYCCAVYSVPFQCVYPVHTFYVLCIFYLIIVYFRGEYWINAIYNILSLTVNYVSVTWVPMLHSCVTNTKKCPLSHWLPVPCSARDRTGSNIDNWRVDRK